MPFLSVTVLWRRTFRDHRRKVCVATQTPRPTDVVADAKVAPRSCDERIVTARFVPFVRANFALDITQSAARTLLAEGPSMLPFPDQLVPGLDPRALAESEASIAIIRPDGALAWVNPAWKGFAKANGGPSVDATRDYFDGITEPLRGFYRTVFSEAAATNQVFEEVYDCSSTDERRIFLCRALPVDGVLLVEHSLVIDGHPGASDAELLGRYADADGVLLQCNHCRRVRGPSANVWWWMSAWAARPHPRTSHVICPLCEYYFWGRRRTKPKSATAKDEA